MSALAELMALKSRYEALQASGWTKPPLDLRAVTVRPGTLTADLAGFETVKAALEKSGCQGWARLRSAIHPVRENPFPDFAEAGPPLYAEWAISADQSVHVRPAPLGEGLIQRTYTERDTGSGTLADGEIPVVREIVNVLRHPIPSMAGPARPVLVYHVFWGAPAADSGALRRLFSRFVKFDDAPCVRDTARKTRR